MSFPILFYWKSKGEPTFDKQIQVQEDNDVSGASLVKPSGSRNRTPWPSAPFGYHDFVGIEVPDVARIHLLYDIPNTFIYGRLSCPADGPNRGLMCSIRSSLDT